MRSLSRNNTNFPWLILPNLSISLWSSYSLFSFLGGWFPWDNPWTQSPFLKLILSIWFQSLLCLHGRNTILACSKWEIQYSFIHLWPTWTRNLRHSSEIRCYDLGVTDIDRNCARTHWSWESMATWDCTFIFGNYHNIVGLTHSNSKDSEIGIPKVQRRKPLGLGL